MERASGPTASERAGQHARLSARPRSLCRLPGASLFPLPGPGSAARRRPQHPGVAHAPAPPQPLPRAPATPPAHVTLAPLFPQRRLPGTSPFSRSGLAALSVPVVSLGGQPRLSSSRGAGAGLLPGLPAEWPASQFCGVRHFLESSQRLQVGPQRRLGTVCPLPFPGAPEALQGDAPTWGRLHE